MRKLVALLALAVVVLLGVFVFFQRDTVLGFFKKGIAHASGLTPAKTPQEAADNFKKAVEKRNYEGAAMYLGGDYGEQFARGAKSAAAMDEEIDSLAHQMKTREKSSDQGQFILRRLAAFPANFEITKIEKKGDDRAVGIITDTSIQGLSGANANDLPKSDPLVDRALFRYPAGVAPIEFKLEGKGSDQHWKMYFPMNEGIRLSVARLNARSADHVQALKKVREDVQHEPMTGKDVEAKLKRELESVAK